MPRDGTRPAIPFCRVDGHQRMNLIIPVTMVPKQVRRTTMHRDAKAQQDDITDHVILAARH